MEWWMLWRTDWLFFPTSAPRWHSPWLVPLIPRTLLFLMSSKVFLLVEELPVISHLTPANEQESKDLFVSHHLVQLQKNSAYSGSFDLFPINICVFCLNYRERDWLGIISTLNYSTEREVFCNTMLNLIGKCTSNGKVGYSLWLNGLQAKPFCLFFFLERELFLKAKVNAVIERTLIHSHVKWPCEESPEGEKALNEFERERERGREWEGGR